MRTVAALIIAVAMSMSISQPASAGGAVRSGTILVPVRPTNGIGPMPGCKNTPDCLAWLATCTQPVAVGVGPSSSVVDIKGLAGRADERTFAIVEQTAGVLSPWVTVELWDQNCRPVGVLSNIRWATFKIPAKTAWMTVVPGCAWLCFSVGGVALRWELW